MYISKKWIGKGWVFIKWLKGILNFVYVFIDKKKMVGKY